MSETVFNSNMTQAAYVIVLHRAIAIPSPDLDLIFNSAVAEGELICHCALSLWLLAFSRRAEK
jgi:hypothetical protein